VTRPDSRDGGRLAAAVSETVAAAAGQAERHDPVREGTGGPAGNAVLTAWLGLVLLVMFVAELLTLFDVGGLISWHVAIGALLIPPALAKTASTGWRILGYYRGETHYVHAGPPPLLLRVLGPLVVVTTLAVLATGTVLVALGEQAGRTTLLRALGFRIDWVTLHQGAFIAWAVATGLHVLGRLLPAVRLLAGRTRTGRRVPGAVLRVTALALTVATAVVAAVVLVRADGSWHQGPDHGDHVRGPASAHHD
jgi:hypothetical protein